jgi:hypothetical protein
MRIRFEEVSPFEVRKRESIRSAARRAWRSVEAGDDEDARRRIEQLDARLSLHVTRRDGEPPAVELTPLESSAWPLAELVLAEWSGNEPCSLALGRMPMPLALALSEVHARYGVDLRRAPLRAGFGRGHLLQLTLGVPGGSGSEKEQIAAENLVRAVLGDRVFETWVGVVDVTPAPRGLALRVLDIERQKSAPSLEELFATVAAATCGVLAGLPDVTQAELARRADDARHEADAHGGWALLEMDPLDERSESNKDDLLLASTCTPELLRCYLDGSPCASRRFSRMGETFVYLRYEDRERSMKARLARRRVIEQALANALAGVGAVTGVGVGVQTSYVDFALTDLDSGLSRAILALRDLGIPERSSIQFFDSELADEWLAIWPDARLTAR